MKFIQKDGGDGGENIWQESKASTDDHNMIFFRLISYPSEVLTKEGEYLVKALSSLFVFLFFLFLLVYLSICLLLS